MRPPSSYGMNNPALEKNIYMHNQKKIHAEEFPERPGEPECSYFMKTGNCKYKSNCKFHHVRDGITKLPSAICTLSDKGLPLRPVSFYHAIHCSCSNLCRAMFPIYKKFKDHFPETLNLSINSHLRGLFSIFPSLQIVMISLLPGNFESCF